MTILFFHICNFDLCTLAGLIGIKSTTRMCCCASNIVNLEKLFILHIHKALEGTHTHTHNEWASHIHASVAHSDGDCHTAHGRKRKKKQQRQQCNKNIYIFIHVESERASEEERKRDEWEKSPFFNVCGQMFYASCCRPLDMRVAETISHPYFCFWRALFFFVFFSFFFGHVV